MLDGYELYYKTYDSKYNIYSKYVVIFWQPEQASIIEPDFPFINAMNRMERQEGRKWIVKYATYYFIKTFNQSINILTN